MENHILLNNTNILALLIYLIMGIFAKSLWAKY